MIAMIDTLKVARDFEHAGFAKAQAESLASTLAEATSASREDLVTKDFLKAELAVMRAENADNKAELVRWLIASQAAVVLVLVALSNFSKAFG